MAALNGHGEMSDLSLLSGVERKLDFGAGPLAEVAQVV